MYHHHTLSGSVMSAVNTKYCTQASRKVTQADKKAFCTANRLHTLPHNQNKHFAPKNVFGCTMLQNVFECRMLQNVFGCRMLQNVFCNPTILQPNSLITLHTQPCQSHKSEAPPGTVDSLRTAKPPPLGCQSITTRVLGC